MRKAAKPQLLLVALMLLGAGCGDSGSAETTVAAVETTVVPQDTLVPTETTVSTTTTAAVGALSCEEPITVGVITDLSGALAIYGAHINRGVPIGFAYATGGEVQTDPEQSYTIDDCEIRVLIRDDESNPELSETVATELIEGEGAQVIIGSVKPGIASGLQEISSEKDVILIVAPDASTEPTAGAFNPNTFRTSPSTYQDHMAICDHFIRGAGYETFVQIASDYPFGHDGAQAYSDACGFYGGEFLRETVFAPANTQDFTTVLSPLTESGADAFLVTWTGGGLPSLLESAIAEGVINDGTVLGAPFVDNLVVKDFFSGAIGTTSVISYHHTAPSNSINEYLIEKVASEFDTVPDLFDADGMNAAIMVIEALKATGGAADAGSLRAALEGMSFDGPKGLVEIRAEDHVAIQDTYIVKLVNLNDPGSEFYENVSTVRPEPPCLLVGQYEARCGSLPVGSLSG